MLFNDEDDGPDFPTISGALPPDPFPVLSSSGSSAPHPAVQAAAASARRVASAAADGVRDAAQHVIQGPLGVSILCILGGVGTITSCVLGLIDIKGAWSSPVAYLINIYGLAFGLMVLFLECEPERMQHIPGLGKCVPNCGACRVRFLDECKFTTFLVGRGLFYMFVGSLSVIQWTIASVVTGFWMIGCGAILLFVPRTRKETEPQRVVDEI